ncbi:MAG: hydantoinase B/oxoprolinase family protein, partial [Candidatus Caldarchaeum sp.]
LEVLRNSFPAICNEMSAILRRTAHNMMIYEIRDYSCALVNEKGEIISQNIGGVSHFIADLGVVVKDALQRYEGKIYEGDVFITNSQQVCGQHLNNILVYTPFFYKDELLGFSMVRAHWIDVGGLSTGWGASYKVLDPWMEGLQLDQLKLYEKGNLDRKLLKIIMDNIRYPQFSKGDLNSQISACKFGLRRLQELFDKYGVATVRKAIEIIFDQTEQRCRAVVDKIPDGTYEAESFWDHDGYDRDQPLRIHVSVVVDGSDMTIDFTGTAAQRRGSINSRTLAAGRIAYKALTTPLEPINEGDFRALKVIVPEGSVMMARFPAPMSAWSAIIPTAVDTVFKSLAPALKDRIPAAHHGTLGSPITFFGLNPLTGRPFIAQSLEGGGWGGRPHEDGESAALSICQGDVRNASVEAMEMKTPIIVVERKLVTDSGGPGKFRGGLAVQVRVRPLADGYWNLQRPGKFKFPPWGLWDGMSGAPPEYLVKTPNDDSYQSVDDDLVWLPTQSEVIIRSAGGGGWGDPLERDPEKVAIDVKEGYVSVESARRVYGVVLKDDGTVDYVSTEKLRLQMRKRGR